MMKKRWIFLMALVLAIGTVTGCSGSSGEASGDAESSVEAEVGTQEADEADQQSAKAEDFDFEEVTVIDNEACALKITGIETVYDDMYEENRFTMTVNMENKTTDTTLQFGVSDFFVNGLETYAQFYSGEILPEKKANEKLTVSLDELEELGITKLTDIELSFDVYDDESDSGVAWQTVHVYPYGEEQASVYVREAEDGDKIFMDNEYATGTIVGGEFQSVDRYDRENSAVYLFIQNKSDQNILIDISNTSLNGYMLDTYLGSECLQLPPGKCGYFILEWEKDDLETNGIETLDNMGFNYSIVRYNREDPYPYQYLFDDQMLLMDETISIDVK